MSLSDREHATLALLDALTGLDFPAAVWDANAERIVVSEQVTWLLDNCSADTLHAVAAVLKAARRAPSTEPW